MHKSLLCFLVALLPSQITAQTPLEQSTPPPTTDSKSLVVLPPVSTSSSLGLPCPAAMFVYCGQDPNWDTAKDDKFRDKRGLTMDYLQEPSCLALADAMFFQCTVYMNGSDEDCATAIKAELTYFVCPLKPKQKLDDLG